MRVQVWNCRGLGQRLTVRRLKEMQRVYSPDLLFLVKTKQKDDYVRDVGVMLGYDGMCIVSPQGLSGGLVVFWKSVISVQVISSDVRLVDLYIQYKAFEFYLSCIYGNPVPKYRNHLWEKLQRIAVTRTCAWMMCGDFNEILDTSEKKGGRIRNASSCADFKTMTTVCGMSDLKHTGNPNSWVGCRRKEIVECCLDRVLVNSCWKDQYPLSEIEFLQLAESDHKPLIVNIEYEINMKRGQFMYDRNLSQHEDFVDTVRMAWVNSSVREGTLLDKLTTCRKAIARWKRRNIINAAEQINIIRNRIDTALRDCNVPISQIHQLRKELNKAFRDEERFWKRKSRVTYLHSADRNTKFYHGITKSRRKKNCIKAIRDEYGIIHKKDEAIAKVASDYYISLYTSISDGPIQMPFLQRRVTNEMNRNLLSPVTDEEIKKDVYLIGAEKTPGPDGFTGAFYQQFWDLVSDDVCTMVKKILSA